MGDTADTPSYQGDEGAGSFSGRLTSSDRGWSGQVTDGP